MVDAQLIVFSFMYTVEILEYITIEVGFLALAFGAKSGFAFNVGNGELTTILSGAIIIGACLIITIDLYGSLRGIYE